jgi:hypothetical protein
VEPPASSSPRDDERRCDLFRYLTADESADYLAVMDLFAATLLTDLSAAEVATQLADRGRTLERDTVEARCRQLVEWGNLVPSIRDARVSSVAEYIRSRSRYQLSKLGGRDEVEILQATTPLKSEEPDKVRRVRFIKPVTVLIIFVHYRAITPARSISIAGLQVRPYRAMYNPTNEICEIGFRDVDRVGTSDRVVHFDVRDNGNTLDRDNLQRHGPSHGFGGRHRYRVIELDHPKEARRALDAQLPHPWAILVLRHWLRPNVGIRIAFDCRKAASKPLGRGWRVGLGLTRLRQEARVSVVKVVDRKGLAVHVGWHLLASLDALRHIAPVVFGRCPSLDYEVVTGVS